MEILELNFWKSWKVRGWNFGIWELKRGDCHPSIDSSCLIKGHGLSTGGDPLHIYIYIYIYTYNCMYIYIYIYIYI